MKKRKDSLSSFVSVLLTVHILDWLSSLCPIVFVEMTAKAVPSMIEGTYLTSCHDKVHFSFGNDPSFDDFDLLSQIHLYLDTSAVNNSFCQSAGGTYILAQRLDHCLDAGSPSELYHVFADFCDVPALTEPQHFDFSYLKNHDLLHTLYRCDTLRTIFRNTSMEILSSSFVTLDLTDPQQAIFDCCLSLSA